MEETVLPPSPNWFQCSVLAVGTDGWLVYGGPTKSLCVLEPLLTNDGVIEGNQGFKAHLVNRAHKEKIVSVDIHPEWPTKRNFITGSADGAVKEWTVDETEKNPISYIHGHEAHSNEKEEVTGVGYSTETVAITVGNFGSIIKWDLNTNIVKSYNFVKSFKPTCISCSQHIPLHVAIGTKQGVIILVDLTGFGKILYKVRGQDDEVLRLMWCPQYEVTVRKKVAESKKRWTAMERIDRIRNEPEPEDVDTPEAFTVEKKRDLPVEPLEMSGTDKNLPEDSFDDSISVPEDDMFDIYKDHEADEFGHKKYVPEAVYVKVKPEEEPEEKQEDFLAECLKLKDDILKIKNEPEPSIESLVEALDNTHVADTSEASSSKSVTINSNDTASSHIHKHLLASIAKHGGVRIWSKAGKLVATCVVPTGNKNINSKIKAPNWPTLFWHKPDSLLLADGRNQLLESNPLKIDYKNKLEWRLVHSLHRRGLYCIMSDAPRVQTIEMATDPNYDDNWSIWTAGQDRNMIRYNLKMKKKLAVHSTCGGFLYDIKVCPYDASKLAVGVGDGAVRVWESGSNDDETKLVPGRVSTYWQNVQGKVLTVAWHPTKENLLAFSTAESRIGLIDTSIKQEKPAKNLPPALNSGVYSMCWGNDMELYACGGGKLVMYYANKPIESPIPVSVTVEGQKWELSTVVYNSYGLLVGSVLGGVALLSGRDGDVIAATFVFSKLIHTMDWHPQQISTSDVESQYKDLLAVCSMDKQNTVIILQLKDKEDGGKEFSTYLTLSGHQYTVLQVAWNPHKDEQLLSTSQDGTVRIWDLTGVCTAIFDRHTTGALGAAWCAQPALSDCVLSGGIDCALRLWKITNYPPEAYEEKEKDPPKKKNKNHKYREKKDHKENTPEDATEENLDNIALKAEYRRKGPKRFLFPKINKQMHANNTAGVRNVLLNYLKTHREMKHVTDVLNEMTSEYDTDYLKMFGNINGVNELLEVELNVHLLHGNFEAYLMVLIFRGHIDAMIQFANQHDLLDPFLLSISPCVSFKYWKDVMQLYISQMDRMIVKNEDEKLNESKTYGGLIYRKAATLLSIHDVKGAVDCLVEGNLYKEAYILCKLRYMESVAEETLYRWAVHCSVAGNFTLAGICFLALGDVTKAATVLGKSNDPDDLNIAAELAKTAGHNAFADHIGKKAKNKEDKTTEEILEELPSRIELLLKDVQNKDNSETKKINGDSVNDENNGTDGVSENNNGLATNGVKDVVNGNGEDEALNGVET